MKLSPEANWRKYKADFLRHNRCTAQEFEAAYIAFMDKKPDTAAYQKFARKYCITIFGDPHIPLHVQAVLSVNIAAVKVMAETYEDTLLAIEEILRVEP